MHSISWRICNDNIRFAVLCNKIIIKNVFHITNIEFTIGNSVAFGIFFSISNCFFYFFDSNDLLALFCDIQGNATKTCIKVINIFSSLKISKFFYSIK